MSDLVERPPSIIDRYKNQGKHVPAAEFDECLDEITRLRAEKAELLAALRTLVTVRAETESAKPLDESTDIREIIRWRVRWKAAFDAARAAIAKAEERNHG